MQDKIKLALGQLDPANDDHWIASGLPAMKAIEDLTGEPGIKRADVEAAMPGFTRDVARGLSETEAAPLTDRVAIANAALEAMSVHLGSGPRFTTDDIEHADKPAPEFWRAWQERIAPKDIVRNPYPMLSNLEKARIAVFQAIIKA